MLAVKEMALLGLVLTLAGLLIAIVLVPVQSNVQVSLVVSPPQKELYAPAGKPINVTCRIVGGNEEEVSSMKWVKDGKEIAQGIPGVLRKDGALILTFTEPRIEESGVYKCLSTYGGKLELEKQIVISFYGSKPTFISGFDNVTAEEGSSVKILCQATGELPIKYTWYNPSEDKISEDSSASIFVKNSVNGSVLSILNVNRTDEGIYTCLAENQHGLQSKLYQITVLNKPIPDNETTNVTAGVRNVTVLGVTSSSVKFILELYGDPSIIEVNYSEIRNTTKNSLLWRKDEDFIIKDLIPGGLYTFMFRAFPGGVWTRAINVTLLPDVPEVIFQNIGKGTVRIAWERVFDDVMRGTIDRYELTYFTLGRLRGVTWEPNKCAVTITIPSCSRSSYTITGLYLNVYYEIQLRAHTKAGYGEPYRQKIYTLDV